MDNDSQMSDPPSSPRPSSSSRETTPSTQGNATSSDEPSKSDELTNAIQNLKLSPPTKPDTIPRVAFVLDRFSTNVPVIYCTNDDIIPRSLVEGRSFYDFITPGDEKRVRSAIDAVKGWGVNEQGGPSDGGFTFHRFRLCVRGRDSTYVYCFFLAFYLGPSCS